MGDILVPRYWCHMCSQMVNPIMEAEIKCPFCDGGFVEEMDGRGDQDHENNDDMGSDRALSLWAPILLGMMGGGGSATTTRRRRFRREEEQEQEASGDSELDRDSSESIVRRRRRSSAAILQLLQGLRAGLGSEVVENSENERERERVILINPFNQAVILQGSFELSQSSSSSSSGQGQNHQHHHHPPPLGDYLIGPGLEMLLQHLAESDTSRQGTPPAEKEAVESMPTVRVRENSNLQCSVCLDDLQPGSEAREMPCKHKFHSGCIVPWLELHSSCPVCRFQMPTAADGSKDGNESENMSTRSISSVGSNGNGSREVELERNGSGEGGSENGNENGNGNGNGNGRRFWVPVPWPFNGLFSSPSASENSPRHRHHHDGN